MNYTLDNYIKVVAPYIPQQLISTEHLSHIQKIATLLPSASANIFAFECRLGEMTPRADFFLCANASAGGRDVLAGHHPTMNLPKELLINSVWSKIHDFCLDWANPTSPLYKNADNIWFEFDVDGEPPEIPIPSLFFGVKKLQPLHTKNQLQYEDSAHIYQWGTNTALKLLDIKISLELQRKLFDCFSLLPPGAEVFHIGVMLSRESEALRLCVRGIPPEKIVDYLSIIGWTGSVQELNSLVYDLSKFAEDIHIAFDVGNIVFPKIGFECCFGTQNPNDSQLRAFLDYLVASGMCLPVKRDAILNYPGYCHEKSNPELWPSNLIQMSSLLGESFLSSFARILNHIKVVYEPGNSLEAKAYLFMGHNWLPINLLQRLEREKVNLAD